MWYSSSVPTTFVRDCRFVLGSSLCPLCCKLARLSSSEESGAGSMSLKDRSSQTSGGKMPKLRQLLAKLSKKVSKSLAPLVTSAFLSTVFPLNSTTPLGLRIHNNIFWASYEMYRQAESLGRLTTFSMPVHDRGSAEICRSIDYWAAIKSERALARPSSST